MRSADFIKLSMKVQDMHTAKYLMICVVIVIVGACSNPRTLSNSSYEEAATDIKRDLSLAEGSTVAIQVTQTDLGREELGPRDEAVVLTENNGKFTLRYVYRFPQSDNSNFRRWRLWANHENAGDGTGAEEPAIKEYAQKPSPDQVEAFRIGIVNHWSNR